MAHLNPTPVLEPGQDRTMILNMGPQHPSTHGVLRVKMVMDGEFVDRAEPVCGYIHRMQEKMGENRTYAQFLPNTSRIDYLSAMTYTHAFVGAVERAAKLQVPPRAREDSRQDDCTSVVGSGSVQVASARIEECTPYRRLLWTERVSVASEPRERSAPTKRRARERVGESEGRSPVG